MVKLGPYIEDISADPARSSWPIEIVMHVVGFSASGIIEPLTTMYTKGFIDWGPIH